MLIAPTTEKKWIQTNDSDIDGNLFATFGCDFWGNKGKLRSGDLLFLNTSDTDQANLGCPIGFRAFNLNGTTKIITVAGGRAFSSATSSPASSFTEITSTPTDFSTDYSDIEVFNDKVYISKSSTTVATLDTAGTWGSFTGTGAGSATPHMFTSFGGRMYMTAVGASVISWDTSNTVAALGAQYTITLNNADTFSTYITFIRASSNRIWIGTLHSGGGKGYVYEWDGSSTQATKSYRLDSSGALACVIKDDIPYIMNTNGEIQVWNGGTFKSLNDAQVGLDAQFYRISNNLLYSPLNTTSDRFIHPNGMTLVNGNINLFVKTDNFNNVSDTEVTIPAGVWEYLPKVGLYHKSSPTYAKSSDSYPYTDSGQIKIARAGAISEMNIPTTTSTRNGTFICGGQYYSTATATKFGIWYDDSNKSTYSPGYFITQKTYAKGITEIWQKLFILFRKFEGSSDKIVLKYRTSDGFPLEGTITWTSTTTFTTTADLSTYAVGDEVQVIQGIGSGKSAHITVLSYSAPTYTVTVDETYTGATSQTAIAWFDHWVKVASVTDMTISFIEKAIGKTSTWIRFKVAFNFIGFGEIETLLTANVPSQQVQ